MTRAGRIRNDKPGADGLSDRGGERPCGGVREQRGQIAAIVGGAVGWRALGRELAGKIPFGGGLIPKAAIAYAGTYTVGVGLERFYRLGSGLTRQERRLIYESALKRGKELVKALVELRRGAEEPPSLPEA